jgi:signal transduction histidine kinase
LRNVVNDDHELSGELRSDERRRRLRRRRSFSPMLPRIAADRRDIVTGVAGGCPGAVEWPAMGKRASPRSHAVVPTSADVKRGKARAHVVAAIRARRNAEAAHKARLRELEHRTQLLRQLAFKLTLTEQHAREQLAKSLHNDLQQALYSSRLRLDRLASRMADRGAREADLVGQVRDNLDEAIRAAGSLARELFPLTLHDAGLPASLMWFAAWAEDKYGLHVELMADPEANPTARDLRTLLFESLKELLLNVAKHAQTDRVAIELAHAPNGAIRLTVADCGVGFEPARVFASGSTRGTGLGLLGIRERLALFGGQVNMDAAPGRGARITVMVHDGTIADTTSRARRRPRRQRTVIPHLAR